MSKNIKISKDHMTNIAVLHRSNRIISIYVPDYNSTFPFGNHPDRQKDCGTFTGQKTLEPSTK